MGARTIALLVFSCPFLTPVYAQTISDAHLVAHQFGWAIVDSRLNLTLDNGATWTDITPDHDSSELVSGAFFADKNTGYLTLLARPEDTIPGSAESNDDIAIEKTVDGGHTWTRSVIPSKEIPTAFLCCTSTTITFVDAQHGWISSRLVSDKNESQGDLFATEDGGKSWQVLSTPPSANPPVFVTAEEGWIVGPNGHTLSRTQDGGHTWKLVSVPPRNECTAKCNAVYGQPVFEDNLNGRIAVTFYHQGESCYVIAYTTRDGGNTWSQNDRYVEADDEITSYKLMTLVTPKGLMRFLVLKDGTLDLAVRNQHNTAKLPGDASGLNLTPEGFINNDEGWILAAPATCASKTNCSPGTMLLVTSDAGKSYASIKPDTICPACATSSAPPEPKEHKKKHKIL